MTEEQLEAIIEQFDEDALIREGMFSILRYGRGADESFIRANKEGLALFALVLLKSGIRAKDSGVDKEQYHIPFDYAGNWIDEDSDTVIQHIELVADKQKTRFPKEYKPAFRDKIVPYGCVLILIVLLSSTIVGLITIIQWLL